MSEKPIDNALIVIDEGSMLSSPDLLQVIKKAKTDENNKIIIIGDRK